MSRNFIFVTLLGFSKLISADNAPTGTLPVSSSSAAAPSNPTPNEYPAMDADRTQYHHGIQDGQRIFIEQSEETISHLTALFNDWSASPEKITGAFFWNFLKYLGKKRREIAQMCHAQDVEYFGVFRGGKIVNTPTAGYELLTEHALNLAQVQGKLTRITDTSIKKARDFSSLLNNEMSNAAIKRLRESDEQPEEFFVDMLFFQVMLRDKNQVNATWLAKQYFKHDKTSITHAFYVCLVPQNFQHGAFGNIFTCGSAEKNSQEIAELFALFKDCLHGPTSSKAFIFFHKFAITMPYKRGSCAVNEWILRAFMRVMGITLPAQRIFAEFDQKAQISSRPDFVQFMLKRTVK